MKKFTFILAALFAATFANAQITLEKTFSSQEVWPASALNREYEKGHVYGALKLPCPFYYTTMLVNEAEGGEYWNNEYTLQFLNQSDFSVYKTINLKEGELGHIEAISYNVFATNKIAFITTINNERVIKDEDGNILLTLEGHNIFIEKCGSGWKLIDAYDNDYSQHTKIYSLPGNGEALAVSTPSSPKRSARKIARDGQVLVETDTNIYTLQGAEVK